MSVCSTLNINNAMQFIKSENVQLGLVKNRYLFYDSVLYLRSYLKVLNTVCLYSIREYFKRHAKAKLVLE